LPEVVGKIGVTYRIRAGVAALRAVSHVREQQRLPGCGRRSLTAGAGLKATLLAEETILDNCSESRSFDLGCDLTSGTPFLTR